MLSSVELRAKSYFSFIHTGVLIYSPAFISVMSLLSLMTFKIAVWVWTLINYGALAISILLILRTLNITPDAVTLSLVSFMVFSFQPLLECTALGQSNLILLCMLSLSLWATKKEKPYLAGLFLSFAIHIKPQFALLVFLFPLNGMYRHFTSTIVCYCLIAMASLPFSGLNLQLDYVRALLRTATYAQDTSMLEWGNNLSLLSAMTKLVGKTYIEEIRLLNAIFSVAVLVYVGKQFRAPYNAARFTQEFAHATALVLLLVPVFEEHYLVLLFLPFLCLFAKLPDLGRYGQTAFILAYLLVALRYSTVSFPPFRFGLPSLLANGKLYGLFIVVVTAFLLWKKSSTGLQKHV